MVSDITLDIYRQDLHQLGGGSQNSEFEREKSETPGRTNWITILFERF